MTAFLKEYIDWYEDTKDKGYISLITCNHDTVRPRFNMDFSELKLCYAFLFTLPGVPFLYYGDEIGMRYQQLPTKEGGYFRTGSRTPMQWTEGKNLGFSEGCADALYLPVDPASDAPTVESQEQDQASLLNTVRRILNLRHQEKDLQADAALKILSAVPGRPVVYSRGGLLLAVNAAAEPMDIDVKTEDRQMIFTLGEVQAESSKLQMGAQSFAVLK